MSDLIRVRAIQPVFYNDQIYSPGQDWEAQRESVQGLLDMDGQLEEVKEPTLIAVPEVGLYLPTDSFVEPEPVESPSEKPKKGFG